MKKLFLILVAGAFISLVACKKDRICTCTSGGEIYKITYDDASKRQGKANCVSVTYDNGDGTFTKEECTLD